MIGTNYESMYSFNRSIILRILSRKESCTRAELAKATGLTQASISKIIGEMIDIGLIIEGNIISGKKGRRSISISLNRDFCKVIAVKLARKSFDVAVYQFSGEPIDSVHRPIGVSEMDPNFVLENIKTEIYNFLNNYSDIKAIGIAVPGPFLMKEGKIAIMSGFAGWEKVNIYDAIHNEFDIPICIEHDANASAFAEWKFGESYGVEEKGTLISFLASEGVGAGIVNNGKIVKGFDGVAGEIGHMSIDMNGPKCVCGNHGCLELYTSGLAFAKTVKMDLKDHPESSLNSEKEITAETVFEHMRAGDAFATEEVKKVGTYIGYGMANIIYLYNPGEIIMTDIMTGGGDVLLDAIRKVVKDRTLPVLYKRTNIRMSTLKHDAILMGASALASKILIDTPTLLYGKSAKE